MRRSISLLATAGLLAIGGLAGCSSSSTPATTNTKTPKVGVILPDSASSARWETADRKYLEAAFKAANVQYDIQNAQNDKTQFQTIADQMITNGATVLMIVNLDSGSGKAVIDKAKSQGVGVVDYDRLTLNGGASYYVSFDNTAVGKLQGQGLVDCLTAKGGTAKPVIAELNGSPTDNNATLFKQGYDSVLKPKYDSGAYTKGPDQAGSGVGQHPGRHDLRADADPDRQQDRRRAGGERRPRQRGHHRPQAGRPQRQGAGDRAGRDRSGSAEHPRR